MSAVSLHLLVFSIQHKPVHIVHVNADFTNLDEQPSVVLPLACVQKKIHSPTLLCGHPNSLATLQVLPIHSSTGLFVCDVQPPTTKTKRHGANIPRGSSNWRGAPIFSQSGQRTRSSNVKNNPENESHTSHVMFT